MHYSKEIEIEKQEYTIEPPTNWINKAEIEFKNYSMRYRPELPLALNKINLKIKDKEKIGICGRTGNFSLI
jgi:ATP-binding cassette subfamily C (CFTR/MRP) protein 1